MWVCGMFVCTPVCCMHMARATPPAALLPCEALHPVPITNRTISSQLHFQERLVHTCNGSSAMNSKLKDLNLLYVILSAIHMPTIASSGSHPLSLRSNIHDVKYIQRVELTRLHFLDVLTQFLYQFLTNHIFDTLLRHDLFTNSLELYSRLHCLFQHNVECFLLHTSACRSSTSLEVSAVMASSASWTLCW